MPSRLIDHSYQLSIGALYYLILIWPCLQWVTALIKRQGKAMTYSKAIYTAATFLLLGGGTAFGAMLMYDEPSAYAVLGVSRFDGAHVWAKRYLTYKKMLKKGRITQEFFMDIDRAYDLLYDKDIRTLYDSWGTDGIDPTFNLASQWLNTLFFYGIWAAGIYAITSRKAASEARTWGYAGLVLIAIYDLCVRFTYYSPPFFFLPQTTPYDITRYLQHFFPIYVLFVSTYKELFYADPDIHRRQVLKHLKKTSKRAQKDMKNIKAAVKEVKEQKQKPKDE